jgi:hypothetical protein
VPDDTDIALCGLACIHFDGQAFTGQSSQCRRCVIVLRERAMD